MMYPYTTFPNDTLVTHSHILGQQGEKIVEIHFKRPIQNGFDSARSTLPSYIWIMRDGFTDIEIKSFMQFLKVILISCFTMQRMEVIV